MKCAFLFPGQGSQYVGMGKSLVEKYPEAREVYREADRILETDLSNVVLNGPEEKLRETRFTQPAIFAASAAVYRVFEKRSSLPASAAAFVAGHSLGEYSALLAADVFDFQTGLKLVKYRGSFLQEACEKQAGAMAAVMGLERDALQTLCEESADGNGCCEMVNFNSPGQIVVAGTRSAIDALSKKISAGAGAKAIPLAVSGAFHSALMSGAAQKMSAALEEASFSDARVPVVTNCDARITVSSGEFREKLARQIDHAVLWEDSMREMIANGVEFFIEIGPGKVLSGLARKIDRKIKTYNIEDDESLEKTLKETNA